MMRKLSDQDRSRIAGVISRNAARLAEARGFIAARPGFPVRQGVLHREPAIIALVRAKMAGDYLDPGDEVPATIEGVPVDVVVVDPQLELELFAADRIAADAIAFDAGPYEGLPGDPIDAAFEVSRPLVCHVGPDSGWVVLRDFVQGTREDLTAAIYDFNAEHIANTLIDTSQSHGFPIKLAIDDGISQGEELPLQKMIEAQAPGQLQRGDHLLPGERAIPQRVPREGRRA